MAEIDGDPDQAVFELLCDEVTRRALEVADGEAHTAKELAERCEVSEPTIYRKVNAMESMGLIDTSTRIERSGNHVTVYESTVDRVEITLDPTANELSVDVVRRHPADRFKDLWEGLREQ